MARMIWVLKNSLKGFLAFNLFVISTFGSAWAEECKSVSEEAISVCRAEAACGKGKTTHALGMALGGFSAGFSGGQNQAYDNYNNCIDRDLYVQRLNAENAAFLAVQQARQAQLATLTQQASLSASSPEKTIPSEESSPKMTKIKLKSHRFFVQSEVPGEGKVFHNLNSGKVEVGQQFGFQASFVPQKQKVKVRARLRVPKWPGNFGCDTCDNVTVLDKNEVEIEYSVDGTKGSINYHWGLGTDDPLGKYEMEFYVNDQKVDSVKFAAVAANAN
jgi:hypothetical protein